VTRRRTAFWASLTTGRGRTAERDNTSLWIPFWNSIGETAEDSVDVVHVPARSFTKLSYCSANVKDHNVFFLLFLPYAAYIP